MARISTFPVFKNLTLNAGDTGTSDPIDLRYCSTRQNFSLSHSIAAGTSTTCGTTFFSYTGCSLVDGTYVALGTFGTSGPTIIGKVTSLSSPTLVPFMKIIATQSGAGNAGANSKVTAELNVQ